MSDMIACGRTCVCTYVWTGMSREDLGGKRIVARETEELLQLLQFELDELDMDLDRVRIYCGIFTHTCLMYDRLCAHMRMCVCFTCTHVRKRTCCVCVCGCLRVYHAMYSTSKWMQRRAKR